MIIGLSGYAQSGKDTVGRILVKEYGFRRVAFADKIREALYVLNPVIGWIEPARCLIALQDIVDREGWEAAKMYTEVRRLLQRMGTEVGRRFFGENCWIDAAFREVSNIGNTVITDVRFPNEADAIRLGYSGEVWRINRHSAVNMHISETALDAYAFDRVISNTGTIDDLRNTIVNIMDNLLVSSKTPDV
jgi:hypothetical protein